MRRILSIRQFLIQISILILSNIVVISIVVYFLYSQSIDTSAQYLKDIVGRQRKLIETLYNQGKSRNEIVELLGTIHSIGNAGEFTVGFQRNDSIVFLLAKGNNPNFKFDDSNTRGLPMRLALTGQSGFVMGHDYKGDNVYAAYTFCPKLGWGIVAKMPINEFVESYWQAVYWSCGASVLLIVLWVLIFVYITKPIIKKIVDSEEHYRSLFENNQMVMLLIDPQSLKIVDANSAACSYFGYKHDKLTSLLTTNLSFEPENQIKNNISNVKSGLKTDIRAKLRLSDGSMRETELFGEIIKLNDTQFLYIIVKDITQQLLITQKLQESEDLYRTLFKSINDAVLVSTLREDGSVGNFIQVNDIACERLQYSVDELLTMKPYDIHSEKMNKAGKDIVGRIKQEGSAIFELEHVDKYGKVIPVEISSRLSRFKNTTVIISIARDISERKLMEQKFNQQLTLMRNTQSVTKIGGWEWSLETNSIFWTDEMFKIHDLDPLQQDYSSEDLIEYSWKCYSEPDRERIMLAFQRCATLGESYDLESKFTTYNGRKLWIKTSAYAEWNDNKISKIIGCIADITDRKRIELLLKEKSEEIEAQNEEYKQINSELLLSKGKAEENDRLKTAFLQNMSHEIRTPMNAIMGFSDLLPASFNDKEKLAKFSKIIKQRSSDLLKLINELLDIAKIESGQLSVYYEQFDINDLFAELYSFFEEHKKKLNKQHITLVIENNCSVKDRVVITDKVKLKQIFINLIGNALKFTAQGSVVAGCCYDNKNMLQFYVSDTGIGIPNDKFAFIFERFSQINHENKMLYGGTGLGLSIVKGLVELLGGVIDVKSEIDKGTEFTFSLSYQKATINQDQTTPTISGQDYDFKGKTVLIVEDDEFNAEYLKEVLSDVGIIITHVMFGQSAQQLASMCDFDIILMDINLPDMNGYDVITALLTQKPHLKIIAQTAYAANSDKQKAFNCGCVDYISKPTDNAELLLMLSQHFKMGNSTV